MANDELDIRVQVPVEADVPESVSRIKKQIPSIESGLKGDAIKIPLQVDASDTAKVVKQVIDSTSKASKAAKVTVPVGAAFTFDVKNQEALRSELKRLVAQFTQNKGKLTNFTINTAGTDRARKVLLTYKNEAQETVKQILQLKKATEALAPDGTKEGSLAWKIDNTSYTKDIKKLEATQARLEEIKRSAEILKLKTPENISLNYEKLNTAIDEGNLTQAKVALRELSDEYKKADALLQKSLPSTAIENLPKQISSVDTQLTLMTDKFKALQAQGAIVPPGILENIQSLSEKLKTLSSSKMGDDSLKQFKQIQVEAGNVGNALKTVESAFKLQNAQEGAQKLQSELKGVQAELLRVKNDWSKAFTKPEHLQEWNRLMEVSTNGSVKTSKQMSVLNTDFSVFKKNIQAAGLDTKTLFGTAQDLFKKFSQWLLVGNIAVSSLRAIKDVFNSVIELNRAFTNLQIVTNGTDEETQKLLNSYTTFGKKIGATTGEIAASASDFLRQGKSIADTAKLIETSMVLSKVANIDSAASTQFLTSAMKGYSVAARDALGIVDMLTSVDLVSASDAGGLAQGMSEVANSANLAGIKMSKLIGYLAAIKETTQAPDSEVGHALSSMIARMSNIKLSRLKDYQNGDEDLSNTETVLRGLGIKLRDSQQEFRNFGDVLDDVAANWSNYSSVQQRAIAVAFASKTNMEKFLTLMNSYGKATEYAAVAENSRGTSMEKMATYEKSVEASQKRLIATTEELASTFIGSNIVKFGYDSSTGILGFLNETAKLLGSLPTLAAIAGSALSFKNLGPVRKTNEGKMVPFWGVNKENQLNQNNIDATSLGNYAAAVAANTDKTTAMNEAMRNASESARIFAVTHDVNTESINKFKTAQESAIKSTSRFAGVANGLKSIAKSIGMSFMNMGISLVASFALDWVIKIVDEWAHAGERAIQTAHDLSNAWKEADDKLASNKKTLDGIAAEYAKLSKGVDEWGQSQSLSTTEFARFNELSNQIAGIFPELITGYTDLGDAILKPVKSIDELNQALDDSRDKQNKLILSQAQDVQKGIHTKLYGSGGVSGYGIQTQQETIAKIRTLLDPKDREKLTRYVMSVQEQAKHIITNSGAGKIEFGTQLQDEVDMLVNGEQKLIAYSNTLSDTVDSEVDSVRRGIMAGLELSDYYKQLPDEQKAALSKVVKSMDSTAIINNIPLTDDSVKNWVQENLIDPFASIDLSGIVNAKSLFSANKMSLGNFQSVFDKFKSDIAKLSPEVQGALIETFSPDTDTLVSNLTTKLSDGWGKIKTLSLDQLNIAAGLAIDPGTLISWDALIQKIKDAQTAEAQTVEALAPSINSLSEMYSVLNSAIDEQAESGAMSYETYTKLIGINSKFASSISMVEGRLQINADKAYELADANTKLQQSEVEAAAAAKKLEYDETAKQLETVNEQLAAFAENEGGGKYDFLADQKDMLESQLVTLGGQLQGYQAITSEIEAMYGAYIRFKKAQQTPNPGTVYDSGAGEMKETLKGGIKSKALNTDEVKGAIDFFVGEGDNTQKGLKDRSKKAKQIADRYFTEKDPLVGLNKFQQDLLNPDKMGELSGSITRDKNGTLQIADGVKIEDIANQLGMGLEATKAMFDKWKEYDADADWNSLSEKLFPKETTTPEEQKTPIQTATEKIEQDILNLEQKKQSAVDRIAAVQAAIKAALTGETPTEGETPTPGTVGRDAGAGGAGPGATHTGGGAGGTQVVTITLALAEGELERITADITGIQGTATITTNATEVTQTLALLGLDVSSLPDGDVTITLNDPNGALSSVSTMAEAMEAIRQGAAASVTITLPEGTTQTELDALNASIAALPPDVQSKITVDASAVTGAVESANTELGKVQDKQSRITADSSSVASSVANANTELGKVQDENPVIDADTQYISGDVAKANGLLGGVQDKEAQITSDSSTVAGSVESANQEIGNVQDKTAIIDADTSYIAGDVKNANNTLDEVINPVSEITADASTVPDTITEANEETGKLQDRTITITTVHKSDDGFPGSSGGGGGTGGVGGVTGQNGGTSGGTGQTGDWYNSGGVNGSIGFSGGKEIQGPAFVPELTDNVEKAQAQMTIFEAIWLKLKSLFTGEDYVVPDMISPTAQSQITNAQDGLDGIANTVIPAKPMSLDTKTAYSQNYNMEQRLDNPVEKKINLKYIGQRLAKGIKNIGHKTAAMVDDGTGKELIKRANGTYELGTDDGPRFTGLDKGDTVYNAEETKKILRRGVTPDVRVGRRFASGTLPSPVGGDSNRSSNSSSRTSSSTDWKKYIDKLFDWIEIRLKRLQEITDKWTRQIERAVGAINKNKAIDSAISSISAQISALQEAASRYEEQAAAIAKKSKLKPDIIAKIQNGTMDITQYDAKTQEKIKAYQEWYEKAQAAKEEIEDLKDRQEELNHQKLDNIIGQYDDMTKAIDSAREKAEAKIENKRSAGKEVTEADYAPAVNAQKQKIAALQEEYNSLKAEFDKQVKEGTLVAGSDAYNEYLQQLADIDVEVINATTDLNDMNKEIKQIAVTNLNGLLTALKTAQNVLQGTLDLINAQGRTATSATYNQLIANGMQQIANLQQANGLLQQQQQGLDKNSDKYREIQEQIDSNNESINGIKVSQEEWNDSIADLKINELQKWKEKLESVNEEYQNQRDLQQAIEDLEKAKSQRKIRILENGQFKYVADTQDVAEKQRALDQKFHEQDMRKIDEVIKAIEDQKATNNVYTGQGIVPTSFSELFPGSSFDDILAGVKASISAGVTLSELAQSASKMASAFTNSSTVNSPSITVAPGAIQINGVSDPNQAAEQAINKLLTAVSNQIVSETYSKN